MDPKQFEERKKIVLELLKKSKGYDISVTAKPLLVDF
jgi:hypothetical protein